MGVNKNKNANAGTDIGASDGIADINKYKDINSDFDDVIVDKVSRNVGKQLKMSKSKRFVTDINCKKSHLSKKILGIKLAQSSDSL